MRRAAATLALVVVVACSTSSPPTAGTTTTTTAPPAPTWTGAGAPPVSRLSAAGGHVVYLAHSTNGFDLVALDPTSGAVAWQLPAAAGTSADRPALLVDGDQVVSFESDQVVRAVDARSGAVRWRAALPGAATSPLARCDDAICVTTAADATGETPASLVALDRGDGHIRTTGANVGAPVLALAGNDVLSIVGTQLVLASDRATKVAWQVPLTAAFASPPSVAGTTWRAWPGPDDAWVVFAGTSDPSAVGAVAGIAGNGTVAWRLGGTHPCSFVDGDVLARASDPSLPVLLCAGAEPRSLLAVDPVSGAAAWTLAGALDNTTSIVRVSPRSWLVDAPVPVDVDIKDGPRAPGIDIVGGWCGAPDPYPCDFYGRVVTEPTAVPDYAGATVAGWGAWIDGATVHAVKLP